MSSSRYDRPDPGTDPDYCDPLSICRVCGFDHAECCCDRPEEDDDERDPCED